MGDALKGITDAMGVVVHRVDHPLIPCLFHNWHQKQGFCIQKERSGSQAESCQNATSQRYTIQKNRTLAQDIRFLNFMCVDLKMPEGISSFGSGGWIENEGFRA